MTTSKKLVPTITDNYTPKKEEHLEGFEESHPKLINSTTERSLSKHAITKKVEDIHQMANEFSFRMGKLSDMELVTSALKGDLFWKVYGSLKTMLPRGTGSVIISKAKPFHKGWETENLTLATMDDKPIECKLWLSEKKHYHLGKMNFASLRVEDDGRNEYISFHDAKMEYFVLMKKTSEMEVHMYILKY